MENESAKTTKKKSGLKEFILKYGYYMAIATLIAILAIGIVFSSVGASRDNESTAPTSVDVISFAMPVANGTIAKGYSDTELQFNSTLNVWETHRAIDFVADIGTDVFSAYDGTITNIKTDLLSGTVVEIDHGNGLKTTYGSLDKTTNVKVGDIVKKGDLIGKASNTATNEVTENGEVHFEVWKDGNLVDPTSYLNISSNK